MPRPARRLLQSEVWMKTVTDAKDTLAQLTAGIEALKPLSEKLLADLATLDGFKDDYAERQGSVPENLHGGEFYEKLEAISCINGTDNTDDPLGEVVKALKELEDTLDECENADLPKD